MISPKENSQPSQPETPQIQNIMVRPGGNNQSGIDVRASMRNAESGIGASLIADLLKGSPNSLENILKNLLDFMASFSQFTAPDNRSFPSQPSAGGASGDGAGSVDSKPANIPSGSLLERARSVADPD